MDRERLLTPAFALAFVGMLLQGVGFNLYIHLPGYLKDLGADEVLIGLVWGLTAGSAVLVRPFVAKAMDGPGRRAVILVGGVLNVVTVSLYLGVTSIGPLLYGVRLLHGVAESMLFAGFFTYAADIIPESRRTQGIAAFSVAGMLPISLGPLIGDAILLRGSYGQLFAAAVVLAVASLLVSLPLREARPVVSTAEGPRGVWSVARQANLLPLWFVGTVFAVAITGPFAFLKIYLRDEVGYGSLGLFFTAYSVAAIALRLGLGWLPDRAGPKRVLFPFLALLGLGLAGIPLAGGDPGLVAMGVLCGLGHGMTNPILNGLVISRARLAERGAAVALYTAVFDVGALVGGPVFGWVITGAGYPAMFLAAGGVVAVGAVVFAVWDRGR